MAEKPPEEGYISVVDEEPEIFQLLKWDSSHTHHQKHSQQNVEVKAKSPEKSRTDKKSREETDPFLLSDSSFTETYRLTKDMVRSLCEELGPVMPDTSKSMDFTIESKVLTALSFYATGKYQKSIGGKTDPSISQYFVSTAVVQVTEAFNDPSIVKKYIHFPHLREERDLVKSRFYMRFGIPNVVGCIDCMHVPIARPDMDHKRHFNKSYHSKKVQIICDSDHNIISVDADYGGCHSHDIILDQHAVKNDLQSLNSSGEQCWLIAGPYYTQRPYLMTPIPKISKKSPVSPEKYYSNIHAEALSTVIETTKQIKSRWKCLQATCNKQFDPETVSMMVVACCVLHNICNSAGLPTIDMTQPEQRLEIMKQKVANGPVPRKQTELPDATEARNKLVDRLWTERRVPPESSTNGPRKRKAKEKQIETPQQPVNQVIIENHHSHHQIHLNLQTHQQHQNQLGLQNHQPQLPPPPPLQPQALQAPPILVEDVNKRPRTIVMNNPTYGLGVTSGWGYFPQHH